MSIEEVPHIPVLRGGVPYESLEQSEVRSTLDGRVLARVGQANAGLVRRDLARMESHAKALRAFSVQRLLGICREAGRRFMEEALPFGNGASRQTPKAYVEALSATSGLPHVLCRNNMEKIFTVFDRMPGILSGLTRGLDPAILDVGFGEQGGIPVCYRPATHALGVVLPSNSPGVNSIWMPSIALKTPVVLKPGREEPWTPWRIVQAFLAAGCPQEAFSLYPTDHEGAARVLEGTGRSLLFGDASVTQAYAQNPAVQIHGPGRSKVLLGPDAAPSWTDHLDVLVASVLDNGGRSCINASSIFVPSHGDEIADALARRLAKVLPRPPEDPKARLSAFANPKIAEFTDQAITRGLAEPGADDITSRHRQASRHHVQNGVHHLLPTVIRCASIHHSLARTEFLFPFVSVIELPPEDFVKSLGPSLVVTAITRDPSLCDALMASPDVDRLNLGPIPTSRVEWDQPHEGNLFEFLYTRRAIQRDAPWSDARP